MNYFNERHLNGITWNNKHSRSDLGATVAMRDIGIPEKMRCEEKPAYSNVKYDFMKLFGAPVYNDRPLRYEFTMTDPDWRRLRRRVSEFVSWLYEPQGRSELRDSTEEGFHFLAEVVSVKPEFPYAVVAKIDVEFEAYPFRIPDYNTAYEPDPTRWPDVDMDGEISAMDVSAILTAVSKMGAGESSGLTPEQELRADANRDGVISAADAALVKEFIAENGAGRFRNTPEGWTDFLNWKEGRSTEVI